MKSRRKDPKYDLKFQYPRVLEISMIVTLLIVSLILLSSKKLDFKHSAKKADQVELKAEDIPVTQQIKRPPPPARPSIPVESDDPERNHSTGKLCVWLRERSSNPILPLR